MAFYKFTSFAWCFLYKSQAHQVNILFKPNYDSRGSTEFYNKILRQISQVVPKLCYDRTFNSDRQTNSDYSFIFITTTNKLNIFADFCKEEYKMAEISPIPKLKVLNSCKCAVHHYCCNHRLQFL